MKIKIYLFFLVLNVLSVNLFSQWITVYIGPTKQLRAVHSSGTIQTYAVGDSGYVAASTNGIFNNRSIGTTANFYSLESFSNTFYFCGSQGSIYKSTNGGLNITQINPAGIYNYYDLDFINGNTGIVVGEQRRFAYTVNGGSNWITGQLNMPGQLNLANRQVVMIDSLTTYIASSDTLLNGTYITYIHKSTNSGVSYALQMQYPTLATKTAVDMQFLNSNTGFVGFSNGNYLKTTNGGALWNFYVGNSTTLKCLYFSDSLTGYTVDNANQVRKTTNGGSNWYTLSNGTGINTNDIFFKNNSLGYAVTANGFILATSNGGGSFVGVNQTGNEIPNVFSLNQNYPNPFNPSTKITFDIPKQSFVRLAIYDILGKEVKVLLSENISAGKYEAEFDASELPSGTYFYKLTSGEFTETKKMMLIK